MIYTSYDYLNKYSDTLGEIIALAMLDKFSFEHIQSVITNSKMINDFEYSDITEIAFSSSSLLYERLFPNGKSHASDIPLFDPAYWIGETYIRIFLKYKLTFETIFTYLPLEEMLKQYNLYHEIDSSQFDEYFESLLKENVLSKYLKIKKMTATELSNKTKISVSTIRSLKEGKRDLNKLQSALLEKIAVALKIKTRSLLNPISLEIANFIL